MFMAVYREWKEASAPLVRMVPPEEGDVFLVGVRIQFVGSWGEVGTEYQFLQKTEEIGAVASQFAIRIDELQQRNNDLRAAIREALE